MRPVSGDSSGATPPPESVSSLGSLPPSDMSLLQSLGPVQSWLGQELEKCGIDAMIYTRYVLSLLLHDSYDYDLQDQENDIFLGWEKGAGKKWVKSSRRKGGTDLSLEEMKKQAAVRCLRSASDENSGVESLVEELCSKLKDIQNKQKEKEKQATKKPDGSRSPESAESPSSKDQVEMYYEAFPPLSEKPVCLQEIMTVWNKARACAYAATSSPKDCASEGEVFKDKPTEASGTAAGDEKGQQRRGKKEKENRYRSGAAGPGADQAAPQNKKQAKNFSGHRPRSWSSGSSEGGSSSGGNQGEAPPKGARIRHKSRVKKGRSNGQVKLALKAVEREERRNFGSEGPKHYTKKGKKPFRELRKDPNCGDAKQAGGDAASRKEYMEEPLWYTEPISEYFVPLSWSKLETKYRSKPDSPSDPRDDSTFQRAYLAAGTFVDGHFVEGTEEPGEPNGTSNQDLDDEHLSEFTHFYEVDIYQSILDPSASDAVRESRILNLIRRKSDEPGPRWESAIKADSPGDDAVLAQDMESIAHVWECCSSSGSEELERESCAGDSPVFARVPFSGPPGPSSCFSLFEPHGADGSAFPFPCDGNRQSRLLIWTKNSAFEENDRCSNLSTRTCSPWSHSEETRSDAEQPAAAEEPVCAVPPVPASYLEEEFLDFLQESPGRPQDDSSAGTASFKVSKLESVCGIALEQDDTGADRQSDDYSSGIIKDIWMAIGDKDLEKEGDDEYPKEPVHDKAVQLSEYHLWEGQKEDPALAKTKVTKVDGGDYATPARPWDADADRDGTSFILGGVYGELKTLSGSKEWTMVPPASDCGDLLQCASASDVVTIAGTDVFMNTGSCFAPGHKPLWKPLVSFGQNGPAPKGAVDGLNKGFSVIFREDLLGSSGGYCGDEQGLEYPFSSLDLDNPFSQVLHVECSFEPEDMASFSPGFKPKSILCSDPDDEPFSPRLYGVNRTQYRAIRISPRTHFRPISASELSPGWCSVSDAESEREEAGLPVPGQTDLFDDPQADLKPLEEDAECEGPYYGKSELESGKFLPRLKKSGMEKSAQTSLDSQEGALASLAPSAERDVCAGREDAADPSPRLEAPTLPKEESGTEPEARSQVLELGKSYDVVQELHEFPLLTFGERGMTSSQLEDCWWQNTLCSSMLTGSRCTESSNI